MSCRVLKRDMEVAMLDVLVERAKVAGMERMVVLPAYGEECHGEAHYGKLGFVLETEADVAEARCGACRFHSIRGKTNHLNML